MYNKHSGLKCLGAIAGDIIGSRFEFNKSNRPPLTLFDKNYCRFTDDTVLTIALMDYFNNNRNPDLPYYLKKWFKRYLDAGYGAMFVSWCLSKDSKPYNSFGNGSAMRVSPVAYVAKSLDECLKLAKEVSEVTHNHPEGIKGAQAIAGCTYLAKEGKSKEEIFNFAVKYYPSIKQLDYKELIKNYKFDVTCQGSVPVAIYEFLVTENYKAMNQLLCLIGGDTDTIGAMAGAIAEAYYGINKETEEEILSFLDIDIVNVIDEFNKKFIKGGNK